MAKDVAKNVAKDVAKNVAKLNTLSIRVYFIADHHKVAANKIRNSRSALFRWCFWAPNESRRSFTYPLVIFSAQPLDCLTSFQIVLDVHSTFSTAQLFNLLNCSTISNYSGRSLNCSTFSLFNLLNRLTTQLSQLFNFLNRLTAQLFNCFNCTHRLFQIKKSGYFHKLPDSTNRYSFQKCKYNSLFIYLSFQLFKN